MSALRRASCLSRFAKKHIALPPLRIPPRAGAFMLQMRRTQHKNIRRRHAESRRGIEKVFRRFSSCFRQPSTPENETIQNIALQDYEKFYEREITARKALRYPPFSRIIKVTIRDETLPKTEARSAKITRHLDSALKKTGVEYEILGPVF